MKQAYEIIRYTESKERFRWLSEAEKLLNNLEALKITATAMSSKTQELNQVLEETQFNIADSRSLRVRLNKIALKLGLEPIAVRKMKP